MPIGSKVHKIYMALKQGGYSESQAAQIAQEKTGLSLVTGRRPVGGQFNGKKDRKGNTKVG